MRARRLRLPLALIVAAVLSGGCLTVPDDETQIRDLVHDRSEAGARGDTRRIYRLQDPDFRAVCDYDVFRTLPLGDPSAVQEVREITVNGVRGSATVVLRTVAGPVAEQRTFVKDAGRWYLYEDAGPCIAASETGRRSGPRRDGPRAG